MSKQEIAAVSKDTGGKAPQPPVRKRRTGLKLGMFVLLLPFLGLLLPTCIVLVVFGLPTLLALLVDRTKEKYLTITTAALNLTGTLPALSQLWSQGQSFDTAAFVISDAWYWTLSFGGAGFAWLIYMAMPMLVLTYFQTSSSGRIAKLEQQQLQLVELWGPEVAGTADAESSEDGEPQEQTEPLSLAAPATPAAGEATEATE